METINLKDMDIDFIKAVNEDFTKLAITANEVNVQRAEFGFVNKDCDFINSMLSTICIHAMQNPDIFNEEQSNNIMYIINKLSHG